MPDFDLDDELARLRDDLRASLPVPGFKAVRERARQRTVRRRMQVGAVAAVLAVSVAIPLLRAGVQPDTPTTPPASTHVQRAMPYINDLEFADADHAYAIRVTCTSRCSEKLLATDDGGKHWRSSALQRPPGVHSWTFGYLGVLGPDDVAVEWSDIGDADGLHVTRIHSADGGRTWRRVNVPDVVTETVPAIPRGGLLVPTCGKIVSGQDKCGERSFAVMLPNSGRSARLANEPPLTTPIAGDVPNADGQWWAAGRDPKSNRWGLSVSDDDGRTWTTTLLNWRTSVDAYGWSVRGSGGVLYASAIGPLPNESNGLLAIFRSTDGGHSWQQTWQGDGKKEPRRLFKGPVLGDDGTLTVNTTAGKTFVSRDGGRSFTETTRRFPDYTYRSKIGYVGGSFREEHDFKLSADGVHWRTFRIP